MREPVGEDNPSSAGGWPTPRRTTCADASTPPAPRPSATIVTDLVRHADQHRDLIGQMARFQTAHGNEGTDLRQQRRDQDDEPEAAPAPRRRTTPTKATKTTSTGRKTTSGGRPRSHS